MNELLQVATQSVHKIKNFKKGQMMGSFKFDGQYLKEGSRVVANVKGDHIRKEERINGCRANLKDDHIRDGRGSTEHCKLKG